MTENMQSVLETEDAIAAEDVVSTETFEEEPFDDVLAGGNNENEWREMRKMRSRRVLYRNFIGTVMAGPPFLGFLLFTLLPMVVSLWISFTDLGADVDLSNADMRWADLFYNYREILQDKYTWMALENSVTFCLTVPINLAVSLFLANLLYSHEVFGSKAFRVILFLPQVCAGTAVAVMWSWLLNEEQGAVNTILQNFHIGAFKPLFRPYTDPNHFLPGLILIGLWQNGTNIILMQSALANVNVSLQEAARIDGANELQVFWKITFPGITPTLFYQVVMQFVAATQEMALMQVLTSGGVGPGYKAITVAYQLYRIANITSYGYAMSCAMSWMYSLLVIVFTRIMFKLSDVWVKYD